MFSLRGIVGDLQHNTVTTTFHLNNFLAVHPELGVDLEWLRSELLRRGATILKSDLKSVPIDYETGRGMHYHFQHVFYPDLLKRYPDHPALRHHIEAHGFVPSELMPAPSAKADARLERLLEILFEPICSDYQRVAESLGPKDGALLAPPVQSLVRNSATAHLPDLNAAYDALVARKIIVIDTDRQGGYSWGENADDIQQFTESCAWPGEREAQG